MAKEEGLFVGYSSGAALQAVYQMKDQLTEDDVVVILLSDHGSRYLSKIFNDLWMKEQGFLPGQDVRDDALTQQQGVSNSVSYYKDYYKRYRRFVRKSYKMIRDNW